MKKTMLAAVAVLLASSLGLAKNLDTQVLVNCTSEDATQTILIGIDHSTNIAQYSIKEGEKEVTGTLTLESHGAEDGFLKMYFWALTGPEGIFGVGVAGLQDISKGNVQNLDAAADVLLEAGGITVDEASMACKVSYMNEFMIMM